MILENPLDLIPESVELGLIDLLILMPEAIPDTFSILTADMFGSPFSRWAARKLEAGETFSRAEFEDYCRNAGNPYIFEQYRNSLVDWRYAASLIFDRYERRQIIYGSDQLSKTAQDINTDYSEAFESFLKETTEKGRRNVNLLSAEEIYQAMLSQPDTGRIWTGNRTMDEYYYATGGSRRAQLEYVLGISSHGKTHYMTFLAEMYARQGNTIDWFQFENSSYSTVRNFAAYASNDKDRQKLFSKIRITDKCRSIQDVTLAMRRISHKRKLDIVVVDYVQAVSAHGFRDPRERINFISEKLRESAKDFDCYIIAGSQVARDKTRKGYKSWPGLQDAKESSNIEQDAFIVTSVFRPNSVDELRRGDRVLSLEDETVTIPKNALYFRQVKNRDQELDATAKLLQHTEHGLKFMDMTTAKMQTHTVPEDLPTW
jgi:replicative DNA helicase